MAEHLTFHYDIPGDDFTRAGAASSSVKNKLKLIGIDSNVIRKVSIAMYEGEINMVIHANGGTIDVDVSQDNIRIVWQTQVPASPTWRRPCRPGTPPLQRRCAPWASAPGWGFRICKNIRIICALTLPLESAPQ